MSKKRGLPAAQKSMGNAKCTDSSKNKFDSNSALGRKAESLLKQQLNNEMQRGKGNF